MAKLAEVCEILDSQRIPITASNRNKGIYPYYGANGIQDYVDDFIFDDELVLLAEDGGNFGSKTKPIAYRVSGKCWVNNHAHVLKPKRGIDVDYLCYSLMFYDVGALVNGATRQKLTQADMRKMEITLRSPEEQKQIVSQLKKVDELISLRKKQLQKLDDLVKSRFVEMFGDPVNYKGSLTVLPMTDICTIIDGDRGENYPKQEDFSISGYCLFLNAKNVTKNGFDYSNCMYISKAKDDVLRKGKLQRGDIVLTTRGTIGNLAFYSKDVPFDHVRINSGMVLLRMKGMMEEQFFIEQFRMLLDDIRLSIASGSAQPQLPISTMNKIMMIVPNKEKQRQFVEILEAINKTKSSIQAGLDKLEQMKQALMQKYFA